MPATRTGLYLTLVTPPEGVESDELARRLVEAELSDLPTVRSRLMRVPPCIIGECLPAVADACAGVVRELGGDAVTVPMKAVERLGGTIRIRDMRIEPGVIEMELWRGQTARIPTERIDVLVRASDTREESTGGREMSRTRASMHVARTGPAYSMIRAELDSQASAEKRIVSKDWLDIHTKDGSVFQVDGDKFGFGVLGDMKKQGDRVNMDQLLDLLSHLCPNAVVDTYFPMFKPTSSVKRLKLPGMVINEEDPVFAFYSRWAALVYRYVMQSGAHGA